MTKFLSLLLATVLTTLLAAPQSRAEKREALRIFIFAGQSNMEGADSRVDDVQYFPPFRGLEKPQPEVRFSYCIGRDTKTRSNGWTELKPVRGLIGPELSFAHTLTQHIDAPIGIIKCAAGGTHLGGDWNPTEPQGFKMYPLTMDLIQSSLADLDKQGVPYQIEAVMWHQGENDMFEEEYMANYGPNLAQFISQWRQDLALPNLPFNIGELCTKTIWGMDLRPRMYAISQGQRAVTTTDPNATYVPTSHIGVEIGQPVGLHYHYGTLGQLEHGVNYAHAYLRSIGKEPTMPAALLNWPDPQGKTIKLFVMAGHRNMEGERAFIQELTGKHSILLEPRSDIAFKYSIGGGYKKSEAWEALRPTGYYDTFGPELSFGRALSQQLDHPIALAKFTHSGSQLNDWTPEGSMAESRHLYPQFIQFIKDSIREIKAQGNQVELEGIFYHVGENEMSMPPYRKQVAHWLASLISQSRQDLGVPTLHWHVSQQAPTDEKSVNTIPVTSALEELSANDRFLTHLKVFDLPPQRKRLVIDTPGIVWLGERLAESYLKGKKALEP